MNKHGFVKAYELKNKEGKSFSFLFAWSQSDEIIRHIIGLKGFKFWNKN
jgi:hypothetical protein